MLDTLIEENSNRALIVPFTYKSGNTYSFPSEMSGEILTALYEGRKVISSGLGSGPYEATMWAMKKSVFKSYFMATIYTLRKLFLAIRANQLYKDTQSLLHLIK